MNSILSEKVDFSWQDVSSHWGNMTLPVLNNGTVLHRKRSPFPNSMIYVLKGTRLIPAVILDGEYDLNGRIIDQWTWKLFDGTYPFGVVESGSGAFYELQSTEIKQLTNPINEPQMVCFA